MRGLVYKDLMTELHELRRVILFTLIALFGLPLLFAMNENDKSSLTSLPLTMGPVVGMVMINNTFGFDEKSGWMQFALTNPVSRMQYYHAKFATHAINVFLGCSVGFLAAAVLGLFSGVLTGTLLLEMLLQALGTAAALFFVGVIFIPLYLKFGVQKGAVIIMVIFLICGVGGAGLGLVSLLTFQGFDWILVIIGAVAAAVVLTMYLLGRKWVMEKEF